jgi:multidrug resistance efflux pump
MTESAKPVLESPKPPPAATSEPPKTAEARTWKPPPRRPYVVVVIALVGLAAIVTVLRAWDLFPFGGGIERTDNAYVHGRTTVISPQVSGYVTQVPVRDFDEVGGQQVLVRIDDSVYRAKVEQAQAALAGAESALSNDVQSKASAAAALLGQSAALESARAQLIRAKADMVRADQLVGDGSISIRESDLTRAALAGAEAQVHQAQSAQDVARQNVRTVDVARAGLQAQVASARAQLNAALIDLGYTIIRAPEAGQLSEVGVRVGQYVTNGTQMMSLVPRDRWVIAEYKEAQTAHMRVLQSVSFTVDALDGARLKGHIDRLAPAAASEFAVLKPDNATGNFVKVPQRIGIRITVDPSQPLFDRLRPGMSVETSVETSGGRER